MKKIHRIEYWIINHLVSDLLKENTFSKKQQGGCFADLRENAISEDSLGH